MQENKDLSLYFPYVTLWKEFFLHNIEMSHLSNYLAIYWRLWQIVLSKNIDWINTSILDT